jgi:epoxide hydrolase-like predicted phosphatase
MIKAVIFDVGGVLLRTADQSHRQRWEDQLGLRPGGLEAIVLNSEMGHKAQRGEISDEALWAWAGERLDLGKGLDAFRSDFWAGDVLDQELIAFIRTLRPAYQTAIISNATDALTTTLTRHGIIDAFDLVVGSAEEGIMKPDPAIFISTLARLNVAPEEAVFIDDFQHNISAAHDLGLATIHFQPGVDVVEELAALGVTVPEERE